MRPIFLAFQDFVFHVIEKKFHNKNIARKISNCCFQGFYLLQVFSISKIGCLLVQYIVFNILRDIVHNILANANGLTIILYNVQNYVSSYVLIIFTYNSQIKLNLNR